MGLAGRKVKQRIGNDPRNLTWADDASKFGANYLAKFGWDSSKGLGAEGQGRLSHIKVSQKLDMLGIGAAQSKDPNGIAWKQNKDFETLLKRLNESAPTSENADSGKDVAMDKNDQTEESKEERKNRRREEKEAKKRKREERDDEDQKVRKRAKSADEEEEKAPVKQVVTVRRRAHRARAIAAKSISTKSAASISEVLGIAPSSSTPTPTATPSGTLTPHDQDLGLEKITTSTKSVADYFKERLLAKVPGNSTPLSSVVTPNEEVDEDFDDAPRGGLGSVRTTFSSSTSSFQTGMSKIASMFTSATVTIKEEAANVNISKEVAQDNERIKGEKNETEEQMDDKEARKKAKEERKREKAEKKERKRRKKETEGL